MVTGGIVFGLVNVETLPRAIVDGMIVGLIIVIALSPTPPTLTHPDILNVPIVDPPDPGVALEQAGDRAEVADRADDGLVVGRHRPRLAPPLIAADKVADARRVAEAESSTF